MGTTAAWTTERRAKHAEAIRRWRPWEKSTGPRTEEGKAKSSRNAAKLTEVDHDLRARLQANREKMKAAFGRQRW